MVKYRLQHFLAGLSACAHFAAIPQDVAEALAWFVLRTALQRAVPFAAIENSRGDLRFGTFLYRGEFRHTS